METQLILADLAGESSRAGQKILLGPWCSPSSRDYPCIGPIIDSGTDIVRASRYCRNVYEQVLPKLSTTLNKQLSLDLDTESYRLLLGNWLRIFIEATYDRYLHLHKALELHPDLFVNFSLPNHLNLVLDYPDFQRALQTPLYNRYLCLQLLSKICSRYNANFPVCESDRYVLKQFVQTNYGTYLSRFSRILGILQREHILITNANLPYYRKYDLLRLLIRGKGKFVFDNLKIPIDLDLTLMSEFRNNSLLNSSTQSSTEFPSVVAALTLRNLPVVCLEGLCHLIHKADTLKKDHISTVYTNFGIHNNSLLKTFLALNRGETKIICQQHGGRYCLDEVHFPFEYENEVADEMLIWGNSKAGITMPSLKLATIRRSGAQSRDVLLGLGSYNRFHQRYVLKPQYGHYHASKYRRDTELFISHLELDIQLTIRQQRKVPYKFSSLKRGITYDNCTQPFDKILSKYRLYCVDHLGTTMLEAFSANIPTIVFVDQAYICFTNEAFPIMAELESAGVIHYSPTDAGAFVNKHYSGIEHWWNSNPVREALKRFMDCFALVDGNSEKLLVEHLTTN